MVLEVIDPGEVETAVVVERVEEVEIVGVAGEVEMVVEVEVVGVVVEVAMVGEVVEEIEDVSRTSN